MASLAVDVSWPVLPPADVAFLLSKIVTVELASWGGRNSSLISAMVVIDAMWLCARYRVVD